MTWTWDQLKASSLEEKKFVTWTNTGRAQKVPFLVALIDADKIVFVPRSGKPRNLTRGYAQLMMEQWDAYKRGEEVMGALRNRNFNTSYMAGVLRTLDEDSRNT